jgi:hypothetical protein
VKTEAIEQAIRQLGLDSKDWRTDELAAAALNELAALRQASRMAALDAAYAPFQQCCGGSDEHPPQHTQDCPDRAE